MEIEITNELFAYKFSETAKEKADILNGKTPNEFLKEKYSGGYQFGLDDLQRSGVYRLMGWAYNFKPYLKLYLVKQYGSWQEYWSPNKTLLRKTLYGKIDKIVEIK